MRYEQNVCPECGAYADAQLDKLWGFAVLTAPEGPADPFGQDYDWEGTTDVDWDSQEADVDGGGRVMLRCTNGHDWRTRPVDDTPADALAVPAPALPMLPTPAGTTDADRAVLDCMAALIAAARRLSEQCQYEGDGEPTEAMWSRGWWSREYEQQTDAVIVAVRNLDAVNERRWRDRGPAALTGTDVDAVLGEVPRG